MAERKHSRTKDLSPERIRRVRALREAAARRRRALEGVLALIFVALIVCGVIFNFSLFWSLIPGVLLLTVLAFGIRTSRHALEWEKRVAALSRTRSVQQAKASGAQSTQRAKKARANRAHRPLPSAARPVSEAATKPVASEAALMNQRQQEEAVARENAEAVDAQEDAAVSIETAPTFIIPLDDVRSILREQFEANQAEQAKADREHAEAAKKNSEKKSSEKQDSESKSSASSKESGVEVAESLEIKSYKQVAKAVPLSGEAKRAVLADATPSVAMKKTEGPQKAEAAQANHDSEQNPQREDEPELVDVNAFGSDVDSILARRRR